MDQPESGSGDTLNADFQTDFELDTTSGNLLKIRNEDDVNREKITARRINNTLFSCLLKTVQYGTWDHLPAALLIFDFHFGYRDACRDRFTGAAIEIEFQETKNSQSDAPDPRNKKNDPEVKLLAPVRVLGNPSKEKHVSKWFLEGNLTYQIPLGPQAGVTPHKEQKISSERQRRMWINGDPDSDDYHGHHNRVVWMTGENKVEETGILHNFPAAIVIVLPSDPKHCVKAKVVVTPHVAFSVNLIRLFPKRDDPIFLDRTTPKGPQYEFGKDFSDSDYPWGKIIKIPTEYEVRLTYIMKRLRRVLIFSRTPYTHKQGVQMFPSTTSCFRALS
ncbi:hypothetical protein IMSHALPRED_008336 [Imshaugia aleurites]|uniref:Uncharacterized protein n=1 Tax=Imshaugia aleurites TaxID=172621 RepID=A0A8H3IWE5_9LECA|nr:hypothetical protein IMSHALPRED_008336 [Imshaugia aleurites]